MRDVTQYRPNHPDMQTLTAVVVPEMERRKSGQASLADIMRGICDVDVVMGAAAARVDSTWAREYGFNVAALLGEGVVRAHAIGIWAEGFAYGVLFERSKSEQPAARRGPDIDTMKRTADVVFHEMDTEPAETSYSKVIDAASLAYLGVNRVKANFADERDLRREEAEALTAGWVEAFYFGTQFERIARTSTEDA